MATNTPHGCKVQVAWGGVIIEAFQENFAILKKIVIHQLCAVWRHLAEFLLGPELQLMCGVD